MVSQAFTSEMADQGAALLRKLDGLGLQISAALWFYLEPSDTWRFILASPEVQSNGPKQVYARIQKAVDGNGREAHISLRNISVVPSDDSLIKLLRSAVRTTKTDVSGIRFSRNTINGQFVEDAHIYRLT